MKRLFIAALFAGLIFAGDGSEFWKDGYAVQTTVKAEKDGKISAQVDGEWQDFDFVEFPEVFMDWNKARRTETIEVIEELMSGQGMGKGPELAGPHNGIVATVGYRREDAIFSLNNAVKGMGFLPKMDKIKSIIKLVEETNDDPMPEEARDSQGLLCRSRHTFRNGQTGFTGALRNP